MSDHFIDQTEGPSLAILVETVTSPLLMEHPAPICLEVDIDQAIPVPSDPVATTEIVRSITRQILATLPDGGDLMLTACHTEFGLELEFADNGPDCQERSCSLPMAVAQAGATLRWRNCPQGGAAATITFPPNILGRTSSHRSAQNQPRKAA